MPSSDLLVDGTARHEIFCSLWMAIQDTIQFSLMKMMSLTPKLNYISEKSDY